MKSKLIIGITSAIVAIALIIGGVFLYQGKANNLTLEAYESSVHSMITDVRSGSEKWLDLLGGGTSGQGIAFVDLCTPVYAEKIRVLGKEFIQSADDFERIKSAEVTVQQHEHYQTYFNHYRQIGERMVQFSEAVEDGKYDIAITEIDAIISLYDTLPELY